MGIQSFYIFFFVFRPILHNSYWLICYCRTEQGFLSAFFWMETFPPIWKFLTFFHLVKMSSSHICCWLPLILRRLWRLYSTVANFKLSLHRSAVSLALFWRPHLNKTFINFAAILSKTGTFFHLGPFFCGYCMQNKMAVPRHDLQIDK